MNFTLLFTILSTVTSAVLPKAEAEIEQDNQLIENIMNEMQSLMGLSTDEIDNLSIEKFDLLLEEIFPETDLLS